MLSRNGDGSEKFSCSNNLEIANKINCNVDNRNHSVSRCHLDEEMIMTISREIDNIMMKMSDDKLKMERYLEMGNYEIKQSKKTA
jgi:hypothetical protein